MCSMRMRCRMHDAIYFAYLGEARNNACNSVGAEIYEKIGLDSLQVTYEVFESIVFDHRRRTGCTRSRP